MVVSTPQVAMRAAVGSSIERFAADAVRECLRTALQAVGDAPVRAALVFATVGYDQTAIVDLVHRELTDDVVVVGCSGEGIISYGQSYEQAHAMTIVLFTGTRLGFHAVCAHDFGQDAVGCGRDIAEQVRSIDDASVLLLFPDGITGNATALLDTIEGALPDLTIVGGASGDMFAFEKTYQYAHGVAHSDSVVGLVVSGPVRADINVNHGCRPIGRRQTITRSDGVAVAEIDGRPAWEVFQEYLGRRDQLDAMDIVHLCLGRPARGQVDEDYGQHVIRMPLGQTAEGAVRFPGGLKEGTHVRMTRRDPQRIAEATAMGAQSLAAAAPDAFLVLQFDCAGRGMILFGDRASSAVTSPVRDAFACHIPVVGLHTFGEIAPLGGRTEYHNYTVALLALTEVP